MNNYQRYFKGVTYKPKYFMGDRVRGFYHGVPFVGTVDLDTLVDQDLGPYVMVNLDLPIKFDNMVYTMLKVQHKDLFDVKGSYAPDRKAHRKKRTLGGD